VRRVAPGLVNRSTQWEAVAGRSYRTLRDDFITGAPPGISCQATFILPLRGKRLMYGSSINGTLERNRFSIFE